MDNQQDINLTELVKVNNYELVDTYNIALENKIKKYANTHHNQLIDSLHDNAKKGKSYMVINAQEHEYIKYMQTYYNNFCNLILREDKVYFNLTPFKEDLALVLNHPQNILIKKSFEIAHLMTRRLYIGTKIMYYGMLFSNGARINNWQILTVKKIENNVYYFNEFNNYAKHALVETAMCGHWYII